MNIGIGLLILVIFISQTVERNKVWRSEELVWLDITKKSPMKLRGHLNLGQAYQERGNLTAAEKSFLIAMDLCMKGQTGFISGFDFCAGAESNLAAIYLDSRQLEKARPLLLKALQKNPEFWAIKVNLAVLEMRSGRNDLALNWLNQIQNNEPEVEVNREQLLSKLGRCDESLNHYKLAIQRYPAYKKTQCAS